VYVNDIVNIRDDTKEIESIKKYLQKHFLTKDLESLKYFLGIEVATSKRGIPLSQMKYILDLLLKTWMLGCRSIDSLIDMNMKLLPDQGKLLKDVGM